MSGLVSIQVPQKPRKESVSMRVVWKSTQRQVVSPDQFQERQGGKEPLPERDHHQIGMDSLVVFFMTGLDAKGKILTDRCHEKKRVSACTSRTSSRPETFISRQRLPTGRMDTWDVCRSPEPFAAFLAPVVFRHDPVFGEMNVRWSANTTHAPITSVS